MLHEKLNNADLWNKIHKLREIVKSMDNFKTRTCWSCNRELNIYDFLSDNIELTLDYLLKLWQMDVIQFHCCDCFKKLKIRELEKIYSDLNSRFCSFCEKPLNIYDYSRYYNYLKIGEIKSIWLDQNSKIFCDKICLRKYYNIKGISSTIIKKN
ncbi:MAG: hypothetical protein ACFFBY_07065 [Promethearchaeota archaeon]